MYPLIFVEVLDHHHTVLDRGLHKYRSRQVGTSEKGFRPKVDRLEAVIHTQSRLYQHFFKQGGTPPHKSSNTIIAQPETWMKAVAYSTLTGDRRFCI